MIHRVLVTESSIAVLLLNLLLGLRVAEVDKGSCQLPEIALEAAI